jgi:hypothetical protein
MVEATGGFRSRARLWYSLFHGFCNMLKNKKECVCCGRWQVLVAFTSLSVTLACNGDGSNNADAGTDGGDLPPKICRSPDPLGDGPYFKQATQSYKLEGVQGIRLATADINDDGYPDLIVHQVGSNNRDDWTSTPPQRYRYLLLNVPGDGGGRAFKDITQSSGFFAVRGGGTGRSGHLAVFADVNNDGLLDAFSGTYVDASPKAKEDPGDRSEVLLGDGKGGFSLAPKSDVSHKEMYSTTAASFLDYDRDGNIDLFVGFWYEIYGYTYANQDRLYRGNGDGTFTEVTDQVGLTTQRDAGFDEGTNSRPTYGVTACDIDGDGDSDLMVSAYGRQWNMLWRNDDGKTFVDMAREAGFDGDANQDYSDNEMYRCHCQATGSCTADPPRMQCSNAGWNVGVDDKPFRNNGNTFTTVCGDYDNDGDMDLFNAEIRHWWAGGSSDRSEMLVNSGTTPLRFTRPGNEALGLNRTYTEVDWNEGDISAALFDFDGDGLQDLILMGSDYPNTRTFLFRQKADHTFEELAVKAGIDHKRGQEVSVADLDNDGDLDVLLGTSTMRPDEEGPFEAQVHAYENLVGNRANWLKVRLIGAGQGGANRSAIGAWVKVKTGEVTQLREVGGGYGHFGLQHDLVLHFGLGKSCEAEQLEVRWPDKARSTSVFSNVRANYLVEIDQNSGELRYVLSQEQGS